MRRNHRRVVAVTENITTTTIMVLPLDIIVDILSRLPIKSIVASMSVCQTWHSLVSDPHFAKIHLPRSSPLHLLHPLLGLSKGQNSIYLVDDHQEPNIGRRKRKRKHSMPRIDFETFFPAAMDESLLLTIRGSCNGMLCLVPQLPPYDPVYVYNPIKREYVTIPPPNDDMKPRLNPDYGFGLCHKTGQYKVVRIVTTFRRYQGDTVECEVHTLGSHTWRSKEQVPFEYHDSDQSPWIPLNGALHWLVQGSDEYEFICCFKIHEEELSLVPIPESCGRRFSYDCSVTLGTLQDHLVVFDGSNDCLDVWVMKDYGVKESWTKSWAVQSGILKGLSMEFLEPVEFREDGEELLMSYNDFSTDTCPTLVFYNPHRKRIRKHKFQGIRCYKRMGHLPTFLSPVDVVTSDHGSITY